MSFSGLVCCDYVRRQTDNMHFPSISLTRKSAGVALCSPILYAKNISDHFARNWKPTDLSVETSGNLFSRERLLESQGYDVVSAPDGRKALHMFTTLPVDLVVLDFGMPEMDGGMVAQEIKRHDPKVPVIMISAMQVPEDALASVDCFIRKAEDPTVLFGKIKELLSLSARP